MVRANNNSIWYPLRTEILHRVKDGVITFILATTELRKADDNDASYVTVSPAKIADNV